MIKVVKWEFLKRCYDIRIFYIPLIGIVIVNFMLPGDFVKNYDLPLLISSLYGIMLLVFTSIYTIVAMVMDLRHPNIYLEKTAVKKPWEVLGSKLADNFIWLNIMYGTILILSRAVNRFSSESKSYLQVEMSYYSLIIIGIFLPLAVLFCYLAAKSMAFTRGMPVLTTAVIIVGVSVILSRFLAVPFVDEVISGNRLLQAVIIAAASAGLFYGSCKMYEKYYEV